MGGDVVGRGAGFVREGRCWLIVGGCGAGQNGGLLVENWGCCLFGSDGVSMGGDVLIGCREDHSGKGCGAF